MSPIGSLWKIISNQLITQKKYNMEQKNKTLDLQGLFDFIENGERFRVFDK